MLRVVLFSLTLVFAVNAKQFSEPNPANRSSGSTDSLRQQKRFSLFKRAKQPELQMKSDTAATQLYAGVAAMALELPEGVPLAGYGSPKRRKPIKKWGIHHHHGYATHFKPAEGVLDSIHVKAMLLQKGERELLFMSLDVVAVTAWMAGKIEKQLLAHAIEIDDILISATHTHSGPGTLSKSKLWGAIAADKYQPDILNLLTETCAEVVKRAQQDLKPVTLYHGDFPTQHVQKNRRKDGSPVDSVANVLLAYSEKGGWQGGLVNIAVHGTCLGAGNLKFSADLPGGIERASEAILPAKGESHRKVELLFLNGAEGDIQPADHGHRAIDSLGGLFADQFQINLANFEECEQDWEVTSTNIRFSPPMIHVWNCTKDTTRCLQRLFPDLKVPLKSVFPASAELTQVKIGDILMCTWPGEPTSILGMRLKQQILAEGYPHTWILGLTNGHLGYFTTPEQYKRGGYEICGSLFGKNAGTRVAETHAEMVAPPEKPWYRLAPRVKKK